MGPLSSSPHSARKQCSDSLASPSACSIAAAPNRIAELESVVVSASARRAGIGRALCRAVLDWSRSQGATELVLEVRASSSAAIALYAGLGFTLAARRPRYYRDPDDDALLMRMELQPNGGRIDD